jgi:hypothetical protein
MTIKINDSRRISEIQEEFNAAFPYLKLEFFEKLHDVGVASPKNSLRNKSITLGECRTIHNKGTIDVTPQMTVTDFEQKFSKVYGLSIQVFRRSGRVWLETTITDGWTLEEQNKQGSELSKQVSD